MFSPNTDLSTPVPNSLTLTLGAEIKQPTVVDPIAFDHWKTEAFGLWTAQWAALYEPDSQSRNNINNVKISKVTLKYSMSLGRL